MPGGPFAVGGPRRRPTGRRRLAGAATCRTRRARANAAAPRARVPAAPSPDRRHGAGSTGFWVSAHRAAHSRRVPPTGTLASFASYHSTFKRAPSAAIGRARRLLVAVALASRACRVWRRRSHHQRAARRILPGPPCAPPPRRRSPTAFGWSPGGSAARRLPAGLTSGRSNATTADPSAGRTPARRRVELELSRTSSTAARTSSACE